MGLMTRAGTGLPTPAGPHVWGLMFCGQHPVILSKLPLNLCFVSKVRWAKACGWGRGLRSSSRAATVSSPPQDLLSAPGSPGPWKLKCAIILFFLPFWGAGRGSWVRCRETACSVYNSAGAPCSPLIQGHSLPAEKLQSSGHIHLLWIGQQPREGEIDLLFCTEPH